MLKRITKVEVCDARDDASCTKAGNQTNYPMLQPAANILYEKEKVYLEDATLFTSC
jgi:hypothetical protein